MIKNFGSLNELFISAVSESFKGPKDKEIAINVGRIDTSCYSGFGIGESYLVYAFGTSTDNLHSGACTRTDILYSSASDLHYIRELLKGIPESRVYGSVMREEMISVDNKSRAIYTPLENIKVLIEGEGKRYEAVTDKEGMYRMASIPDGRYKAHAILPERYRSTFFDHVEFVLGSKAALDFYTLFEPGAAANIDFRAGWNNSLSGTIVDGEGNPIVRAKTAIFLDKNPSPVLITRDWSDHHKDGKFAFSGLSPGTYLLTVEIRAPFVDKSRTTTFYFPNTDALNQAKKIEIGANDELEQREIRLPAEYLVRQIEGVLVWPNGVPVSGGSVFLSSSKNSRYDDKYDWDSTDELGRFSLQAFVGASTGFMAKAGLPERENLSRSRSKRLMNH